MFFRDIRHVRLMTTRTGQQSGNKAEQIVLLATLVLILVLLLIIFRSPIIALLPLVVIAVVSQVATGVISDVNKALNLNADSSISTSSSWCCSASAPTTSCS